MDQSAGDFGEAEAEMMGDILEEDEGRFDFADDPGDVRPEMAWVVDTPALENNLLGLYLDPIRIKPTLLNCLLGGLYE